MQPMIFLDLFPIGYRQADRSAPCLFVAEAVCGVI